MPYKDAETERAYQRTYQRNYARELRKDPVARERLLAVKRTPRQRELENERRRRRYRTDPEYRQQAIAHVRSRQGRKAVTLEGAEWGRVLRGDPCSYCGGEALTLDHIDPWVESGNGSPENLTAACGCCNSSKGTRTLLLHLLARAEA